MDPPEKTTLKKPNLIRVKCGHLNSLFEHFGYIQSLDVISPYQAFLLVYSLLFSFISLFFGKAIALSNYLKCINHYRNCTSKNFWCV